MAMLFSAPTRLEAWLDVTEHLLSVGSQLNIVVSVSSPGSDGAHAETAHARIDQFLVSEGHAPLHTIAETIFPGWEYVRRGIRGVYETYVNEYEQLKAGEPTRWGTYAHRMLRRRTGEGVVVNPLEILIDKMKSELSKKGRGTYRACYEIGIAEGEYDLPLYNTVDDQRRRRGLPCLSHLSFKIYDQCIHLTAIYRSHDYRHKVCGNLLGLARLQACVAREVGLPLGELAVHSTYAWVEGSRPALRKLIKDLRQLMVVPSTGQDRPR